MADLRSRILAAREEWVEAGSHKFLVRRVAELPLARMRIATRGDNAAFIEALVRESIVDWQGVTEATLVPGGGDQPAPFDREVFLAWVEDMPDIWQTVVERVLGVMARHRERLEAAGKN